MLIYHIILTKTYCIQVPTYRRKSKRLEKKRQEAERRRRYEEEKKQSEKAKEDFWKSSLFEEPTKVASGENTVSCKSMDILSILRPRQL